MTKNMGENNLCPGLCQTKSRQMVVKNFESVPKFGPELIGMEHTMGSCLCRAWRPPLIALIIYRRDYIEGGKLMEYVKELSLLSQKMVLIRG